jgi:hypothetical protein
MEYSFCKFHNQRNSYFSAVSITASSMLATYHYPVLRIPLGNHTLGGGHKVLQVGINHSIRGTTGVGPLISLSPPPKRHSFFWFYSTSNASLCQKLQFLYVHLARIHPVAIPVSAFSNASNATHVSNVFKVSHVSNTSQGFSSILRIIN